MIVESIDTWSEEHRYRCLVRHVIRMRLQDRDASHKFLVRWLEKHKDANLERDVKNQWNLGNRGKQGDWRGTDE